MRTRLTRMAMLTLFFALPRPECLAEPVFSYETPHFVKRAVVVGPNEFNELSLTRLARQFLAEVKSVPIAVMYMAPTEGCLSYYTGKGGTDIDFDGWFARLNASLASGWEPLSDIAEVSAVSGEAVLRIRRDGKVSRVVLTTRDPFFFEEQQQRFEILEIHGTVVSSARSPSRILHCRDCLKDVEIYVRCPFPFDRGTLVKMTAAFGKLLSPADVSLHVRSDAWFVTFSTFPMLYAFDPWRELPDAAAFRLMPSIGVFFDGHTGQVSVSR